MSGVNGKKPEFSDSGVVVPKYLEDQLHKEEDEKPPAVWLGEENGLIVLKFSKPVAYVTFDPIQAMEMAMGFVGNSIAALKKLTAEAEQAFKESQINNQANPGGN